MLKANRSPSVTCSEFERNKECFLRYRPETVQPPRWGRRATLDGTKTSACPNASEESAHMFVVGASPKDLFAFWTLVEFAVSLTRMQRHHCRESRVLGHVSGIPQSSRIESAITLQSVNVN